MSFSNLLLLPPPSPSLSLKGLRSEYGSALSQALRKTSQVSKQSASIALDIAIAHDENASSNTQPISLTYSRAQSLLALMYRLVCIICAEESIDLQYDNDVNVSIILFKRTNVGKGIEMQDQSGEFRVALGQLHVLAGCQKCWKCVYYLDNRAGKTLFETFLQIRETSQSQACAHLPSEGLEDAASLALDHRSILEAHPPKHFSKRHLSVAVGGTFDHLHAGHKLLLTIAALILDLEIMSASSPERTLTIGITGDKLLQNKRYINEVQDWKTRQGCVEGFLFGILQTISLSENPKLLQSNLNPASDARMIRQKYNSGLVVNYIEIFDPFGPTITDELISALVISGETRAGGAAVNEKRGAKGWPLLEVFEVDVLNSSGDDNDGTTRQNENYMDKLSSTEIRRRLHERSTGYST